MGLVYFQLFLLLLVVRNSVAQMKIENRMKTEVFLSPKIELEPGSVVNKNYYDIGFPRGHIAVKRFHAEIVDERGNSIPLHETYLHHWVVVRYYQSGGAGVTEQKSDMGLLQPDHVMMKNSGVCNGLSQYFGLGSETRHTEAYVPDPYGIEIGNSEDVPEGYEERWKLNVHAIDTRGAVNKLGCTECRCDLYNVTLSGYVGGLRCCHDGMRCSVKQGYSGEKRGLYMKYTVQYLDWDKSIVPVKIYILDVTDPWTKADESKGLTARHHCLIEYDVESCPVEVANDECTHKKSLTVSLPTGGDVIYGVGHQHTGGIGTTLYGGRGREICSSDPTYGNGDEPGNEAGYIVGMTTCYPSPGSVKISPGEMLTFISKYNSSSHGHTGVMGLFYLLIAERVKAPNHILDASTEAHKEMTGSNLGWAIALFGAAFIAVIMFVFQSRTGREEGYEAVTA